MSIFQTEKYWEQAKNLVAEQSDLESGTEEYYKVAMSVYKELTKCADGDEIVDRLRQEGAISKHAHDIYREESQTLKIARRLFTPKEEEQEKNADFSDYLKNTGTGILAGGTLALAGSGLSSAAKAIQRHRLKKDRPSRLKEIAKFTPTIREMDPEVVNEAMRTLEFYNPEMAKQPLVAGTFLKSIHHYGGVTPEMANILKQDSNTKNVTDILGRGVDMSLKSSPFSSKTMGNQDFINAGKLLLDTEKKDAGESAGLIKKHLHKKMKLSSAEEQTKQADLGDVVSGAGKLALGIGSLSLAAKGGTMLMNKLTRNHRLDKIKEFNPSLKKVDGKLLEQELKTLERLSPQVSRDPLAAGGFLKDMAKRKGVDIKHVKDLVDTSNREDQENPFLTAGKAFGKSI